MSKEEQIKRALQDGKTIVEAIEMLADNHDFYISNEMNKDYFLVFSDSACEIVITQKECQEIVNILSLKKVIIQAYKMYMSSYILEKKINWLSNFLAERKTCYEYLELLLLQMRKSLKNG